MKSLRLLFVFGLISAILLLTVYLRVVKLLFPQVQSVNLLFLDGAAFRRRQDSVHNEPRILSTASMHSIHVLMGIWEVPSLGLLYIKLP